MAGVFTEVVIVLALLLVNALFVMSEMAIVSSRKARLQQLSLEGNKRAGRALDLAQDPASFLSTVQIGITLIGVLLGALGGARLSVPLAALLRAWFPTSPYADSAAFVVVVVLITALNLWLG